MDTPERQAKYWICDDCAKKAKMLPPIGNVTVIKGLCGYCDSTIEVFLTPTIDYDRPGREPWD